MLAKKKLTLMGTIIDVQIESDKATQQLQTVIDLLHTFVSM